MPRRLSASALAHLLLLAVVAIWGATFVLVKDALADASPLLFNLLRMALATVAMVLVQHRHLAGLSRRTVLSGLLAGVFLALGYQLQTAGLARTTPVKSAFLTGLVVIIVPLLAGIPALRTPGAGRPNWRIGAGCLLAFAGLVLLTTPPGTRPESLVRNISVGDLLTLGCALAFAAHLLTLAHLSPGLPARSLATLQIAFCTAVMLVSLRLGGPLHLHVTPRLVVALGVTGVLGTAAAFTVQTWAQQHLAPTHTALLLTLEPVFALGTSALLTRERISLRSLTGGALILAGIALVEFFARPPSVLLDPV